MLLNYQVVEWSRLINCRLCLAERSELALDLGSTPLANALLDSRDQVQQKFPLQLYFCNKCMNLQLGVCVDPDTLYRHYLYVTPTSTTLAQHYRALYKFLEDGNYLSSSSAVLEIGSNSGELLKFLSPHVSSVIGVDPAKNVATIAIDRGIPTVVDFFNKKSAQEVCKDFGNVDVIIARHCFAHNADPSQMLDGACTLLTEQGAMVIENAYSVDTIQNNEFDQVYHEHMYYYSLHSLQALLERHGFSLVDAMTSHIHGGSFVAVAKKTSDRKLGKSAGLQRLLERELDVLSLKGVMEFADRSLRIIKGLREAITEISAQGKIIYSYGATAKGNTLLNVCGLDYNHIKYCVDSTDLKQGKFLPGSEIEIVSEDFCYENPPDYFLLTAWNYAEEIMEKFIEKSSAPVTFIVPFPEITFFRKNYTN